jgi:hypothetical protein
MVVRFLLGLILSFFMASAAFAAGPVYDVVFDLDWTLFYPVKKLETAETVQVGEEFYQPAEKAIEVLIKLHQDGHRLSLFSGGTAPRNQALAKDLLAKIQARGVRDFSFYKVLNFEDLSRREGTSDSDKFVVRFAKDLTKINPDLSHVVLVDDLPEFAVPGQEKNVFGLGRTYVFHKTYTPEAQGVYDPPNAQEWLRERLKILHFYRQFSEVSQAPEPLTQLKALSQGYGICSKVFSF